MQELTQWIRRSHVSAVLGLLMATLCQAQTRDTLTVAAFPAMDEIVRSAIPYWNRLHPTVDIKVVSRQFRDHHTAMTTALSTAFYLPDVMALEVGYVGRFAQGGGLEDLAQEPLGIRKFESRYVPFAFAQGTNRKGAVVAAPTGIGPGTLLYRTDLLAKVGVSEAQINQSWDSYVATGARIKATTGAYPQDILEFLEADAPRIESGDLKVIATSMDFMGVNYYSRSVVSESGEWNKLSSGCFKWALSALRNSTISFFLMLPSCSRNRQLVRLKPAMTETWFQLK